ncbi:MAG: GNAT family N-acetyltransferase [Candidatus Adiutrix sp.]|jgi:ribosomal protein S18 acetylase RimI-like enzyme|nr:GNAT family N-acetyltransferase [Candidatus Adiutrix sp.]
MKLSPFRISPLDSSRNRSRFDSGSEALDKYLREQVSRDIRRRVSTCFVALTDEQRIAGYYTLASAGIPLIDLPPNIVKKLPRYPSVPAVRLGRLAVDQAFKGLGLGSALLADAIHRSITAEIASYAIVVDAKDATAASFYAHHGFIAFPDNPRSLFLPLSSFNKLIL